MNMATSSIRLAFRTSAWKPSREEWLLAAQCIQPEEKERIGKFMFKADAKSAMVGRLLLRRVISDTLSIPYNKVKLSRTEKGKPFLVNSISPDYKAFSFNVSHQGDYAVLAAEKFHPCGIDVMKATEQRGTSQEDFFRTMKRQFTDQEWSHIRSGCNDREQLKHFYRYWCLKESYVKTLGTGIGFEVHRLDFQIKDPLSEGDSIVCSTQVHVDGTHEPDWLFEESYIDDHSVAVAVQMKCNQIEQRIIPKFKIISFKDIVRDYIPLSHTDEDYWLKFSSKDESARQMKKS